MAVPKLRERMKNRKGKVVNDNEKSMSNKSVYLSMKYDYDKGLLTGYRLKKFLEMKEEFEE